MPMTILFVIRGPIRVRPIIRKPIIGIGIGFDVDRLIGIGKNFQIIGLKPIPIISVLFDIKFSLSLHRTCFLGTAMTSKYFRCLRLKLEICLKVIHVLEKTI